MRRMVRSSLPTSWNSRSSAPPQLSAVLEQRVNSERNKSGRTVLIRSRRRGRRFQMPLASAAAGRLFGRAARLEQPFVLHLDRGVALACGLPQPVEIEDFDMAAA